MYRLVDDVHYRLVEWVGYLTSISTGADRERPRGQVVSRRLDRVQLVGKTRESSVGISPPTGVKPSLSVELDPQSARTAKFDWGHGVQWSGDSRQSFPTHRAELVGGVG